MSQNLAISPNAATLPGATPQAASSSSTGSASTGSPASDGIGATFLSLLTKELQNQDPTAPMDSTAMVGQMISLNQLEQLVSINQQLGAVSSASANG